MDKIYLVWLFNRSTRNETLLKGFYSSEMALDEKRKQIQLLKSTGDVLKYDVTITTLEVY